jgi:hypothetical protein
MTLREARCLFTRHYARLITEAFARGYECATGETTRDPRVAQLNAAAGKGISKSLHLLGLAGDLHLYRDGLYLAATADHQALGEWWEAQHSLCRWGGRFNDGNHYSIEWDGRE